MANQLARKRSGTQGVLHILRTQLEKTIEKLQGDRPLADEAVHDARKRLKKVRAGLRLLRDVLGSRLYRQENACFRAAARPLSEVRDAKILVDTLDALAKSFPDEVEAKALRELRKGLVDRQDEARQRLTEDVLGPVRTALEEALRRMDHWPVGRRGWSVLGAGLKRVYKAGRSAFRAAEKDPSAENLHEWRKQAKYLRYQLGFLRPLWPAVLKELEDQAHVLGDHLGDDHDLAVLCEVLSGDAARFPDQVAVAALAGASDRRRADLEEQAWIVGRRLYGEKPRRFTQGLGRWWRVWRSEGPTGEEEARPGSTALTGS
jgi:CHAD domain-containing protein